MRVGVENGTFRYRKNAPAVLSGIDFEFGSDDGRGRILTVLGPNGVGKTTFLRAFLGLHPWSEGRTLLDGKDIRKIEPRQFWQTVGYVPQAKTPVFAMSVLDAVTMGCNAGMGAFSQPGKKERIRAEKALERTGISHLADRMCDEISGGEYQLVLIARALCAGPRLLVLDEPESNLDMKNQKQVIEVLSSLREEGIYAVLNTHFPSYAADLSDYSMLFSRHSHVRFGKTREILTEAALSEAFETPVKILDSEVSGIRKTVVFPVF